MKMKSKEKEKGRDEMKHCSGRRKRRIEPEAWEIIYETFNATLPIVDASRGVFGGLCERHLPGHSQKFRREVRTAL